VVYDQQLVPFNVSIHNFAHNYLPSHDLAACTWLALSRVILFFCTNEESHQLHDENTLGCEDMKKRI